MNLFISNFFCYLKLLFNLQSEYFATRETVMFYQKKKYVVPIRAASNKLLKLAKSYRYSNIYKNKNRLILIS